MTERVYMYPYAGPGGRNYVRQLGTFEDLKRLGIELREGLRLKFWNGDADEGGRRDDLYFEGVVHFDSDTKEWYVVVDEDSYCHQSQTHDN